MFVLFSAILIATANYGVQATKQPAPAAIQKNATQFFCNVGKAGNQFQPLCPFTQNGLHLVCGDLTWTNSTAVCSYWGLQPANVNNLNYGDAQSVIANCNDVPQAWIYSFNGYADDPCMLMGPEAVLMADKECTFDELHPVLCQDYALTNHTVTATTTTTFSYGTSTIVVPTYDPAHCRSPWLDHLQSDDSHSSESSSGSSSGSSSSSKDPHFDSDFDELQLKSAKVKSQEEPPLCPGTVCPLEIGHYRVVWNADCSSYGWKLADITTGDLMIAGELFSGCMGASDRLYIRSFNGITSLCSYLTTDHKVAMSNEAQICISQGLFLCDATCNLTEAVTGSGVASQVSSTTTTWTTTTTTTSTEPTITSTLTSYIRSPHNW